MLLMTEMQHRTHQFHNKIILIYLDHHRNVIVMAGKRYSVIQLKSQELFQWSFIFKAHKKLKKS